MPVAYEVAKALEAPLDIFIVRKLGVPGYPELAMGAIASGGVVVISDEMVQGLRISQQELHEVMRHETRELERRERAYRDGRAPVSLTGKTAILIDDGLATGSSVRAAIRALRRFAPERIVAAVPVGAADTCAGMTAEADEMVCAVTPEPFIAVGRWYADFSETSDDEVRELLSQADREFAERHRAVGSTSP